MTKSYWFPRSKKAAFCFFAGFAAWLGLFGIWWFEKGEDYYFDRLIHTMFFIPVAILFCTIGLILAVLGWHEDRASGEGVSTIGIFGCILSVGFVAYGFYLENLINGPWLKQLFHFK